MFKFVTRCQELETNRPHDKNKTEMCYKKIGMFNKKNDQALNTIRICIQKLATYYSEFAGQIVNTNK